MVSKLLYISTKFVPWPPNILGPLSFKCPDMDPSEEELAVEGTAANSKDYFLVKDKFVMKMMQFVYLLGKVVTVTLFSQCPC